MPLPRAFWLSLSLGFALGILKLSKEPHRHTQVISGKGPNPTKNDLLKAINLQMIEELNIYRQNKPSPIPHSSLKVNSEGLWTQTQKSKTIPKMIFKAISVGCFI